LVEEELVQAMAKQVDGVVLASPRMANTSIERLAREIPLVMINRVVADLPAVVMDLAEGTRNAIDHLVGLGHRQLLYLAGPRSSWNNREIRRSAMAAARNHNARLDVIGPNPPTWDGGFAVAERVRATDATAVLAYNDLMAIGLLAGLRRLGIEVTDELSVVGIDDTPLSALARPALTTVATPSAAAGRSAVDMLLHQDIQPRANRGPLSSADLAPLRQAARLPRDPRRTTAKVILQTTLITRESTGPVPCHQRNHRPGVSTADLSASRSEE
jgi:LacI family transcriptional regulator